MIKYKYQTLSKEEKKEAQTNFYKTDLGKQLKVRFSRLLIFGTLLITFGIVLLVEALIKKDSVAQIIYSIILIIFGLAFIIGRHIVMIRQVNNFIVKKKKK